MKTKKSTPVGGFTCGVTSSASLNGETVQKVPTSEGIAGQSVVIHVMIAMYE